MHLNRQILILLAASCVIDGDCARILAIAPIPSYSHQVAFRPIWRELSLRGHDVTLITTDPANNPSLPNLTEIDVHEGTYEIWKASGVIKALQKHKGQPSVVVQIYMDLFETLTHYVMKHPRVKELLNDTDSFDLVMMEPILLMGFAFAEKYQSKLVLVMSLEAPSFVHSALGNAVHPILYPEMAMTEPPKTLTQKVFTGFMSLLSIWNRNSYFNQHMMWLKGYFEDENIPSAEAALERINMLFVNSNPLFGAMRPVTPSTVYFGRGSHLEPEKPLPTDLKEYLDGAKDGVVYFSLGSNVMSKDLPEQTKKIILGAFWELPFNFLWKFEDNSLQGVPTNVKISKWLPQQDVLRHPNVRAFITQGGLQSTEEAIFCNVPMLGIPQIADQMSNVNRVVELGMGLRLDLDLLEKEAFKRAILDVATNSSYRENIAHFVKLSTDWPMSGIEEVVWWTEYVLRHNSTEYLKGPSRKVPLYQYLLLDVIGTVLIAVSAVLYITYRILLYFVLFARQKIVHLRLAKKVHIS